MAIYVKTFHRVPVTCAWIVRLTLTSFVNCILLIVSLVLRLIFRPEDPEANIIMLATGQAPKLISIWGDLFAFMLHIPLGTIGSNPKRLLLADTYLECHMGIETRVLKGAYYVYSIVPHANGRSSSSEASDYWSLVLGTRDWHCADAILLALAVQ